MGKKRLRIAMIAPPWLKIPPVGYGGIEAVVYALVVELKKMGADVELFSIAGSSIRGVKNHYLYESEQFDHIHKPIYESLPITIAHLQFALNYIQQDGGFDIIHDHSGFIGPMLLPYLEACPDLPPAVHTLHGPPFTTPEMLKSGLPDNRPMWDMLGKSGRPLRLIGISRALTKNAPESLKPHIMQPVYNAIDVKKYHFSVQKKPYFLTLARFSKDKGQHLAARLCDELDYSLKMAGTVAGISTNQKLLLEFANPLSEYRNTAEFRYYSDEILPYTVNNPKITFVGNVAGLRKLGLLAHAKALLFPIDWEEPFGMAVIEALASGTPVIAMNRGAMPEIIQHGKTGFLANTAAEFKEYMQRVDEINPADCRASITASFSSSTMAENYMNRYEEVLASKKTAK